MDGNKCFKLENSKYCPNFNGHYVVIRNFSNTETFEKELKKYFENEDSYKNYLVDNFKCNNQTLPNFRYGRSFICNSYIIIPEFSETANLCDSQIVNDKYAVTIPYCYSSCLGAIDSIEEIVKNPKYGCSLAEYQKKISYLKTICRNNNSEASKCIIGMGDEVKNCGYRNNEERIKYCKQSNAMTEDCCSDSYNYDANNYIYSKGKNSSLPTILFILTIIVSAIVTILVYVLRQKKKKANYRKLNENGNEDGGIEDTSYTLKSSENNLLYVFHEYIPKINDEIQLNVGDIVKVTKIFDDGWAYGTNVSTDCEGALPLACCTEYRTSISSMMMSYSAPPLGPVNHRESSLFT